MDKIQKGIADYIHASKYAKFVPELGRRETFNETVGRVKKMHLDRYPQAHEQIESAFKLIHRRLVLPSMRSMQFAGPPIDQHNARMYNCCFTHIDRPRVFGEIMYLLLCGCGVGYSVQKQHVEKLPVIRKVNHNLVCHYTVQDDIEGWSDAINALIYGFINGFYVEYDYSHIRPGGSILSSRGRAPGHFYLKTAIEAMRSVLSVVEDRQMTPLECHDLLCYIAKAVTNGGSRSSAIMALFSKNDEEMMYCKDRSNFRFDGKNSHRSIANNSVIIKSDDGNGIIKKILGLNKRNFGDPGLLVVNDLDYGCNACGEILINPKDPDGNTGFGFCNLVEINVAGCRDSNDFFAACEAAGIIATLQAGYNKFSYLGGVTEKIVENSPLIGVSITGMMDSPWIFDSRLLTAGAKIVKDYNEYIANLIRIRPSPRCTCIKPSGNSSLELGCVASGIHPHHSRLYFRRIYANLLDPVARFFALQNPRMVEKINNNSVRLVFPIKTEGLTISHVPTIQFLMNIYMVQRSWVDGGRRSGEAVSNNISCTVSVKPDEWDMVSDFICEHKDIIGGLSLFSFFADSEIPNCPRQAVVRQEDRERFKRMVDNYQPVDYTLMNEDEDTTSLDVACDSEKCAVNQPVDLEVAGGLRVFMGKPDCQEFYKDGLKFLVIYEYDGYFIAKRI